MEGESGVWMSREKGRFVLPWGMSFLALLRQMTANLVAYDGSTFSPGSGGQEAEIGVWAGPCSVQRLQGRICSHLFWHLGALGFRWLWSHHFRLCLHSLGASSVSVCLCLRSSPTFLSNNVTSCGIEVHPKSWMTSPRDP